MKISGLTTNDEAEGNSRSCAICIIQCSADTNEKYYYGMNSTLDR